MSLLSVLMYPSLIKVLISFFFFNQSINRMEGYDPFWSQWSLWNLISCNSLLVTNIHDTAWCTCRLLLHCPLIKANIIFLHSKGLSKGAKIEVTEKWNSRQKSNLESETVRNMPDSTTPNPLNQMECQLTFHFISSEKKSHKQSKLKKKKNQQTTNKNIATLMWYGNVHAQKIHKSKHTFVILITRQKRSPLLGSRTQLRMPCFQCPQPGEQSGRGYIAPLNPQSLSGGSTSISLISADTLVRVVTGQGYVSPSALSYHRVQYGLWTYP